MANRLKDLLNQPVFSLKSRTTQLSLILGLVLTVFSANDFVGDSVTVIGSFIGATVLNAFVIYLILLIPSWIINKFRKK